LAMRRAAMAFLDRGENEKAMELMDKFFEAFPHKNFPYDYRSWYMISVYLNAGGYERAKPHIDILARQTADYLRFYEALDASVIESSFQDAYSLAYRTKADLINAARRSNDTAYTEELEALFAPFTADQQQQQQQFPPQAPPTPLTPPVAAPPNQ
jgi:tetratricopeptide (TPR) repeat protein